MQEIATGVYIGNFNPKIRENLWERVQQSVGTGEATLSYACRNEIGYDFRTLNTERSVAYLDGLPLVSIPVSENNDQDEEGFGFSNASKIHYARKKQGSLAPKVKPFIPYTVIDIETEGLDSNSHSIIEVAALSVEPTKVTMFSSLVRTDNVVPENIIQLTGITSQALKKEGLPIEKVLDDFLKFIGDDLIIGYGVNFDLEFINKTLKQLNKGHIMNKAIDLKKLVRKENMYLNDYKLETVLQFYGINKEVPYRALDDSKLIYELSTKVNLFQDIINSDA